MMPLLFAFLTLGQQSVVTASASATPSPIHGASCLVPNREAYALTEPQSVYPESAVQQRLGPVEVQVEIIIDPTGRLLNARVTGQGVENADEDRDALRVARGSTYAPKLLNCVPLTGVYAFLFDYEPPQFAGITSVVQELDLLRLGEYAEARTSASSTLQQDPRSGQAFAVRGFAEDDLGDHASAIRDYAAALKLDPSLERVQLAMCSALYELHRLEDAIASCTAAIALEPEDSEAYDERGLARDAENTIATETLALTDLDRSISLDRFSAWAFSERCELKREIGKFDSALPDCNRALSLDPTRSWTLFQRGMLYLRARDYSLAADDFEASLAHGAQVKYAYNALAQAEQQLGRYADALASIDTFISLFPNVSSGFMTRAAIHRAMGNRRDALADAQHALLLARAAKDEDAVAQARAFINSIPRH